MCEIFSRKMSQLPKRSATEFHMLETTGTCQQLSSPTSGS